MLVGKVSDMSSFFILGVPIANEPSITYMVGLTEHIEGNTYKCHRSMKKLAHNEVLKITTMVNVASQSKLDGLAGLVYDADSHQVTLITETEMNFLKELQQ